MTRPVQKFSVSGGWDALVRLWEARSSREKYLLSIAMALIFIALIIAAAGWIKREQHRLERALPRAEDDLQKVRAASVELADLRGRQLLPVPTGSELTRTVTDSARMHGLNLTVAGSSEVVRIEGRAPFDRLIGWLGQLHKESGVRIEKIDVQREPGTSMIRAILVSTDSR